MSDPVEEQHLYAAALLAIIAGTLTYLACTHTSVPQLWYAVLERQWIFGTKPKALAMAWYGRTAWVAIAAGAGAALGRWVSVLARPRVLMTVFALAIALVLATTADIVASNVDRPTSALPLPAGYQPR